MIKKFLNHIPSVSESAYVDTEALLIGRVSISADSSVWPGAVLRGDVDEIKLGEKSNIQDGSLIHTNYNMPSIIGCSVTVGHGAVLHGCSIGNYCLIGMGAIMLDDSCTEDWTIVGAGCLVPEGKKLEGGFVYMGTPAEKKREITQKERELIKRRASEYIKLAGKYK